MWESQPKGKIVIREVVFSSQAAQDHYSDVCSIRHQGPGVQDVRPGRILEII